MHDLLKLSKCQNGYLIETYNNDSESDKEVYVIEEDFKDEIEVFKDVLNTINFQVGPSTNKYSPKIIKIEIESGDCYEENNYFKKSEEEKINSSIENFYDHSKDSLYLSEEINDGFGCFSDSSEIFNSLKDNFYLNSFNTIEDLEKHLDNKNLNQNLNNIVNNYTKDEHNLIASPKELKANVVFINMTEWRKTKAQRALELMLKVINSEEFKERVYNFRYNGSYKFASTSLSNKQIYDRIMVGSEILSPLEDGVINFELATYYSLKNVIGYTYPNTRRIWVNTRYFDSFYLSQVAGNFTHEYMHKIGFDHDFNSTARRPYSVPYAIGNIVVNLVTKI